MCSEPMALVYSGTIASKMKLHYIQIAGSEEEKENKAIKGTRSDHGP